jgi:hypothetical protein
MWQNFLKNTQKNIVIPPGFKRLTIVGDNKCTYKIRLRKPCSEWSIIDADGNIIRKASQIDVITCLKKYPKLYGSLLQVDDTWIILTDDNICRVHQPPILDVKPKLLTPILCRRMGSAIIFDDFDLRNTNPWVIDDALELLLADQLPDNAPRYLSTKQKLVFMMLLEHEQNARIPDTEKQIKDILNSEHARLLNIQETKNGYALTFNFRGRKRNVEVREDLMLLSSGMCLSGGDKNYSLDTFLSILEHEGAGTYGHPVYY